MTYKSNRTYKTYTARSALALLAGCLAWAAFAEKTADKDKKERPQKKITIEVGSSRDENTRYLGFGWSRKEWLQEKKARWISHLEADVWFKLKEVGDMELSMRAAPLYVSWMRQNIGVFVNGHFVTEWLCPASPDYSEYEVVVPAKVLKEGKNRLTFRMGYRRRRHPDRRELSLAVEKIILKPIRPLEDE